MVKLTVWNDAVKPHGGRVEHWSIYHQNPIISHDGKETVAEGYDTLSGYFKDSKCEGDKWGNTEKIIYISEPNQYGYREVETDAHRYTLIGPELTWEEYVQKQSERHAQTHRILSERPKPVHVQGNSNTQPKQERDTKKNGKPTYYTRATQTRVAPRNRAK